ncbi:hypothetical protein THAOC_09976, partial [Thalassiosira oceanica]
VEKGVQQAVYLIKVEKRVQQPNNGSLPIQFWYQPENTYAHAQKVAPQRPVQANKAECKLHLSSSGHQQSTLRIRGHAMRHATPPKPRSTAAAWRLESGIKQGRRRRQSQITGSGAEDARMLVLSRRSTCAAVNSSLSLLVDACGGGRTLGCCTRGEDESIDLSPGIPPGEKRSLHPRYSQVNGFGDEDNERDPETDEPERRHREARQQEESTNSQHTPHSFPTGSLDSQQMLTHGVRKRSGSLTGLTDESIVAVSYVHSIPHLFRPAIPGLFNLLNASMRWGTLVYFPGSVADMLMGSSEIILSTIAAQLIRKRAISRQRWGGVLLVTVGTVVVRLSHNGTSDDDGVGAGTASIFTGDVLIVGQCVTSVLQDMSEELFMHEVGMSPTMLLGWEGLFGLTFGLLLYFPLAPSIGEVPSETWAQIRSASMMVYLSLLVMLFLVVGVFNITATALTSSMTRNIWKNLRSAVVWTMGVIIFYSREGHDFGEGLSFPSSAIALAGFALMICGVVVYYNQRGEHQRAELDADETSQDEIELPGTEPANTENAIII